MDALPPTLAALIAPAAVLFVALPFLRRPSATGRQAPPTHRRPQLDLLERRDRALAALKELEFDHRTGAIGDADYHRLLDRLRREAAETLHLLDDAHRPSRPTQTAKRRRRAATQTTEKPR